MNQIQVQLACGCWILRPAETPITLASPFSDDADAFHCSTEGHGDREAVARHTHQWRARCHDCRYGGWFGQDHPGAEAGRTRHLRREPAHTVGVAYDRVTKDGKGTVMRWDDKPRPGRKLNV